MLKPEFLVSACLAGIRCRYDGTSFPVPEIIELVEAGKAIPFCPEELGGLSTPRDACELQNINGLIKVTGKSGADYTSKFFTGAELSLKLANDNGIKKAILKARSPSCGFREIYDGTFSGRRIPGNGITAGLLSENGIEIFSEESMEVIKRD